MKKLMLAVALICAVGYAHAGAVNWKWYDIVDPADASSDFSGGMAYLFDSTVDSALVTAALAGGTFLTDYAGSAVYTEIIDEGGFSDAAILNGQYSGSTTLYSVVVDNTTTVGNYIVGDPVTQTIGSSGSKNFIWTYDDNATAWTSVGGSSVPEPTSGLLMLLGMAGLALRRRRA